MSRHKTMISCSCLKKITKSTHSNTYPHSETKGDKCECVISEAGVTKKTINVKRAKIRFNRKL